MQSKVRVAIAILICISCLQLICQKSGGQIPVGAPPTSSTQHPVTPPAPSANTSDVIRKAWTEHLRRSTVSFGTVQTIGGVQTFRAIGTGVLVAHSVPGNGFKVGIATARHVFDDPTKGWRPSDLHVRFAAEEGRTFAQDIGYPITLLAAGGTSLWLSIDGSDVAVIGLTDAFVSQLPPGLLTDGIGDQDFASADDLFEGEAVLVFGFPSDTQVLMGPDVLVRAVTRAGVVAWVNPQQPLENVFMLDANILPGNSGGPVFQVPTGLDKYGNFHVGGRASLLGIVTATLTDHDVVGVGGLGRVEPASVVKKILLALP